MILLRHGQTIFNLHFTQTRRDPGIIDPPLTPHGERQIQTAAQALAACGITRILASPYTRALQTAAIMASVLHAPIAVDPLIRERFAFSCDVGTSRSSLDETWPHDFGRLPEVWWPPDFEPEEQVRRRAAAFRAAMRRNDAADQTLVVSHWAFLLALTGRSLENGEWMQWDPEAAEDGG